MDKKYTIEREYQRLNVAKWKKALRIAEIRAEKICTYEQPEQIYNAEQSKKDNFHKY